jgi:DNA replication protein DnaC
MKKGAYQQLNLTHLEAALPQVVQAAQREQWTYETFLERALASELEGREQQAMARRLKAARIPSKKTLDGFDFSFQPTLSERRLRELADLSFVRTCTNSVFLGPPGTGKTHLSLALADRALTAGHSVLFTTLAELAQTLENASHPGHLAPAPASLHCPQSTGHRRGGLHQALARAGSSLLRAGRRPL